MIVGGIAPLVHDIANNITRLAHSGLPFLDVWLHPRLFKIQ